MKNLRFFLIAFALSPVACVESADAPAPGVERGALGKADLAGSCAPQDCGGRSSTAWCWCDELCSDYGDCCADKEAVCDAPCQPDECGDPPIFVHCADGLSIAEPDLCTTLEDGSCGWTAECALPGSDDDDDDDTEACTPAECGDQPIFVHCADGLSIAAADLCTTLEDGACGWTAECALPSDDDDGETCTPAECGDQPIFVHCADGVSIAAADVCTTLEDGNCGWTATCALP